MCDGDFVLEGLADRAVSRWSAARSVVVKCDRVKTR